MSGLDPDEDAIITENPDPESESAAVNESESVEENLDDRTEGEINAYEGSGQIAPGDNDPPVHVFNEESVVNNVREYEQRIDECVLNQDGDEKTEDEREPGVGVIREGQISGGRDELLSLGQEEVEADTFLVREASSNESVGIRNSDEVLCEHDTANLQGLEHSDSRAADVQESESHCEESTSVITGRDADSDAGSRECNHSLENLSCENSEVVENHVIIPEDELSCQVWTAEDKPQLHVLSPTGSIESCEPECDQETDASPSHGVHSEHVDRAKSNETHQQGGGGEEEGEEGNEEVAEEEETICVVLNPPPPHSPSSESQMQLVCESSSNSSSQVSSVETTLCSSQETLGVSCTGSVNGDIAPVTNNFSENKISSLESDDDLLSELESELTNGSRANQNNHSMLNPEIKFKPPNGMDGKVLQEIQDLQMQLKHSRAKLAEKDSEINRLTIRAEDQEAYTERILRERDAYLREVRQLKSQDDLYLPQIKELEYTIAQQTNEIRTLKDKLASHDAAARRTVATLQNELKVRVDQVTKMYDEASKEKDSMVVKYAQAEKKFIEGQKSIERLEAKVRDLNKEKDGLTQRVIDIKGEKRQMLSDLEAKAAEIQNLTKEVEKQKELISSSDVRIKWAQNKLKAELDAHKETKDDLIKTRSKLKDAKDETEQIRRDCQAIIKTYQESEEIKSNKLDSELKIKESEFLLQQQEKTSQEERYTATVRELDSLRTTQKEAMKEMESLKKKCQSLESQRDQNEQTMTKYREMLQKQKRENKELQDRVEELVQVKSDFKRAQSTIKSLDAEISELKICNKDLQIDMEACRKREADKLDLTNKLSAKNAELQSENSILHNKTMSQAEEIEKLTVDVQTLEIDFRDVSGRLKKEESMRQEETTTLREKLEEKSKAVEELSAKVEDGRDEIRTLKRKHVNNVKDLTRQLQQAKKKLENLETNGDTQKDSTSMGSRTSSSNSLNTMGMSESSSAQSHSYSNKYSGNPEPVQEHRVITEQVEPNSQMLIERIVKLQRGLARRNEKIEFMQEHIQQLVDEIQKKNKIIQNYALREESGTMTLERSDLNKMELSRKHSIMGSLYSSHQTDSAMTLDLSLEINHKLQAVLEDTLLKNITLKESLDTLGGEIARLSQENRKLQLELQGKTKNR